jgi:hypothetical protein
MTAEQVLKILCTFESKLRLGLTRSLKVACRVAWIFEDLYIKLVLLGG